MDNGGHLMTYPCVDPDDFDVNAEGEMTPNPVLQWRHVATNELAGFSEVYDVDAGNQAEDLGELQVAWTNTDTRSMQVYGILTRGGTTVVTTARTRLYLETYYGQTSGAAPADPVASTLHGRMGNGTDFQLSRTPVDNTNANFGLLQTRQAERSSLLGTTVTLTTGQALKLRIRLRVDANFWETLPPEGGSDAETLLSVLTGATRLDLYAIPVI